MPSALCVNHGQEKKILEAFLRMGIEEEEYGYVLEGIKPISSRSFYGLGGFPVSGEIKREENEFKGFVWLFLEKGKEGNLLGQTFCQSISFPPAFYWTLRRSPSISFIRSFWLPYKIKICQSQDLSVNRVWIFRLLFSRCLI